MPQFDASFHNIAACSNFSEGLDHLAYEVGHGPSCGFKNLVALPRIYPTVPFIEPDGSVVSEGYIEMCLLHAVFAHPRLSVHQKPRSDAFTSFRGRDKEHV